MAAYIPVADTVQVSVRGEISGVPMEFVMNFKWPTTVTISIMQALGTIFVDWISSTLGPLTYSGTTFNSVNLTDLTTQSSPSFDWFSGTSVNLPIAGTASGAGAPQQVAFVGSNRTINRGRSFRGRTYLYGIPQGALNTANTFSTTGLAQRLAGIALVISNAVSAGWTFVIVSRQQNGVRLTSGVTTPVTTLSGDIGIKTQRRRLL